MKIRNKITLWITGAGLLAGLLFSIIITYELIEQPYELLDGELESQAHALIAGLASGNGGLFPQEDMSMLNSLGRLYWFKVFDRQKKLVYSSAMTELVTLPLKNKNGSYNVNATIPPDVSAPERDEGKKVTFRVHVFSIDSAGQKYTIQIARPMEKLHEEIVDLIISIIVSLILYTVTLLLLGYFVAGKILQPIADINTLAREISEKTLDKRIPLGSNQDELYRLSSSLNRMFDRLQYSFQRQKEFIANASHELKTPMVMQRLFFSEAQQRQDLPKDFVSRLEAQIQNLYRMDRLVKNMLDLSALERRETFSPTTVNLSDLITSVVSEFREIIEAAEIDLLLDIEKSVQVEADDEKLRRMLINLIDNGVKYNSDRNGELRIQLSTEQDDVRIEVYNSGRGIPTEELKQVFEQFYRVEKSRSTALGGSGLGLTIVKRIVELHHGTIELTSEPGQWVRIQVVLPSSPLQIVK